MSVECPARVNILFSSQENLFDEVSVIYLAAEEDEDDDTDEPVDRVDHGQGWVIPVNWILPFNKEWNNLRIKLKMIIQAMEINGFIPLPLKTRLYP